MRISDWSSDVCSSDLANGLVVLVAVVAVDEVVHGALGRGQHAERAVKCIGDALRDLGVAGDDGGRVLRADHRTLGNDELQRLQAALVQRDLVFHQGAEDIERSEERRVGKGWVRKCNYRGTPYT